MPTIFEHIHQIFKDKDDPVLFEIGACHLEDTYDIILNTGLRGKKFEYYAFEPDPQNVEICKKALARKYVYLIPKAVGAANGTLEFYQSSGNIDPNGPSWTGSGSLLRPKNHLNAFPWCKFDTKIDVEVVTLDDFCKENEVWHINFIWCDVQGNEGNVIQGGQNILKNTEFLYTEYSNNEMYEGQPNLPELINMLPGKWEVIEVFPHDVLLNNKEYKL